MLEGKSIADKIRVRPQSSTVGEMTTHVITFTTPTPILDGYKIYV